MSNTQWTPMEGGCDCQHIRYRIEARPLFVHCCHCRWCQRETGSAFALNAMIESRQVSLLSGHPDLVDTPTESGLGQQIARCPHCHIAVWSHYGGAGKLISFVRVGTLDDPDQLPPDIHIFTESRQPWLSLSGDTPIVEQYYKREQFWPPESLRRFQQLIPEIAAYRASRQ
ncbi:GFA family protein [Gynuella sp.]|uniref:GFA family protein n=1 Tax=Gynuella sp. TaxID=2969146 RepID=UPI003D112B70